jgi:hypothetical protein
MTVYLGKAGRCVTATMTDTCAKETGLTTSIANVGHAWYCFFSSPDLFVNLHKMVMNLRGNVIPNQKGF